jgi:putative acetyltransferase
VSGVWALRPEQPSDATAIATVLSAAFAASAHGDHGEAAMVAALRAAGALTLSLVAEQDGRIIGHVGFSPVCISDGSTGWLGMAPVSVAPPLQGMGVGSALIRAGLAQISSAAGCVVLGNPRYYGRFGFRHDPRLSYAGGPAAAFQALILAGPAASGNVTYHPAFG